MHVSIWLESVYFSQPTSLCKTLGRNGSKSGAGPASLEMEPYVKDPSKGFFLCLLFSKNLTSEYNYCGFHYSELLFMCLELGRNFHSPHRKHFLFALIFFQFFIPWLKRVLICMCRCLGWGWKWKVCYIKGAVFIITCLVGRLGRGCACFSEVPQVSIFLLLCLKLIKSNSYMCGEDHTPWPPLSPNKKAKRDPRASLFRLNLACPSEIEKHWKRSVLPNQNFSLPRSPVVQW